MQDLVERSCVVEECGLVLVLIALSTDLEQDLTLLLQRPGVLQELYCTANVSLPVVQSAYKHNPFMHRWHQRSG